MPALLFYSFLEYRKIIEQFFWKTSQSRMFFDTINSYLKYFILQIMFAHMTVLILCETPMAPLKASPSIPGYHGNLVENHWPMATVSIWFWLCRNHSIRHTALLISLILAFWTDQNKEQYLRRIIWEQQWVNLSLEVSYFLQATRTISRTNVECMGSQASDKCRCVTLARFLQSSTTMLRYPAAAA